MGSDRGLGLLGVLGTLIGFAIYFYIDYKEGCTFTERPNLKGQTMIVTGATDGIGVDTAFQLAEFGARVIIPCRNMTKGEAVIQDLKDKLPQDSSGEFILHPMDLASLQSVRDFVSHIQKNDCKINGLINNAGLWNYEKGTTKDGFDLSFQVNHLAPFLLTTTLLPCLATQARIVSVSSGLHYWGTFDFTDFQNEKGAFNGDKAYRNAKLLNVIFANELQRRLDEKGLQMTSTSLHPGIIQTALHREDYEKRWGYRMWHSAFVALVGKSTTKSGAQTTLYAALAEELEAKGGLYFSDCTVKEPHVQAQDPVVGRRLWTASNNMLNKWASIQDEAVPSSS